MSENRRVVVTGIGAITPLGNNVADTWNGLKNGKNGIAPITLFDTEKYKAKLAAEVKDFDPKEYLEINDVLRTDRYAQFAVAAAQQAVDESGVEGTVEPERFAVIFGTGIGGIGTFETEHTKLMEKAHIKYTPSSAVGTVVYLACDGKYAGCIVIEDEIKADAPAAIKLLKSAGIRKTVMLTGDADAVGKKVAGQLHLDQVYTELLPADKVDRVESLLKQKSEKGMLAFVGDGINDAPVLARADVGIAMGGLGSDAAIEAADVVLMTDEPSKIAAVMKIARKTIRIANQNIVFALGVKFLVLILGALGYANMWAAVFADVGVSIIAILNAIRAMRVKLPDMPAGSTNQG